MLKNPDVKKNDKILLIHSANGAQQYNGATLEVMSVPKNSRGSFTARAIGVPNVYNITIYRNNPADEYTFADKENIVKYLADQKKTLEKDLRDIQSEIDFHTKYGSQEEFVAHKLDALMQASKGNSKAGRVAEMTEILKTLKESHLL